METENAGEYLESCAEVTNFICSALLQNNPKIVVDLRSSLKSLLLMWNTKFNESKNSIEPEGNLCVLDTCRLVSILLGSSINAQLINHGVAACGIKYNSLGSLNEYSETINLSDLASKVLDDDLAGLRITSQIDPIVHNLAFGEKMREESEIMYQQLFQTAEGRDWTATDPDLGGAKLKRITRVLLAALLNHGRGESIVAIHRQVFLQRAALLNEINIYQNEIERKNNNRNRENTETNIATADSDWDGLSQSTSISAGWGPFNDQETPAQTAAAADVDQQNNTNQAQVWFKKNKKIDSSSSSCWLIERLQ